MEAAPISPAQAGNGVHAHRHHSLTEWIVLGVLVALWGSAFAALRIGVESIDPMWVVAWRSWAGVLFVGAAYPLLMAAGRGRQAEKSSRKAIIWFCVIGIAFTAVPVLVFASAAQTEPSAALAICNGASPVFTALMAHRLLEGERMSWRRGAGVALGFLGLIVLVAPDLAGGQVSHSFALLGAIGATLLYAAGNIATRLAPHISAALSSLIITGSGAVVMTAIAAFTTPWPQAPTMASIIAVLALGIGPSGMATLAYVWLIRRSGPMFVSFATYLSPLWATALGVTFLSEDLHWSLVAALTLILAGVAVAHVRPRNFTQAG